MNILDLGGQERDLMVRVYPRALSVAEIKRLYEGSKMRRCVFVHEWECYVEADEIPLEVCKVCIEARRVMLIHQLLKILENRHLKS